MEPQTPAPRALVIAAFGAISVIWGSTYLGIRIALVDFPPFLIGALRFLVAGGMLCGYARLRGHKWPAPSEWAASALVGGLFFVIGNGLLCVAEKSVSSGLAAVLVATMPLWATVFSRAFGESVSRREGIGVALGLLGVAVMNFGGELRSSGHGAVLALLAPMGWALGSVLSKRMRLAPGIMGAGSQMLTGGVAVLLISLGLGEGMPVSPTWQSTTAVAYLALVGSLVGFTAYVFLLRHTRAAVATSYAYVNPVIAILLGIAIGGEHLDTASTLGGAIVLGAVLLVSRGKQGKSTAQSATSGEESDAGRRDLAPPTSSRLRVAAR